MPRLMFMPLLSYGKDMGEKKSKAEIIEVFPQSEVKSQISDEL